MYRPSIDGRGGLRIALGGQNRGGRPASTTTFARFEASAYIIAIWLAVRGNGFGVVVFSESILAVGAILAVGGIAGEQLGFWIFESEFGELSSKGGRGRDRRFRRAITSCACFDSGCRRQIRAADVTRIVDSEKRRALCVRFLARLHTVMVTAKNISTPASDT